jgi:hypothetical protein
MLEKPKKYESLRIQFFFSNDYEDKDVRRITSKVQTFANNSDYQYVTSVFIERYEIQFVVTFDVTEDAHRIYDELDKPLQRLIDSHKEAATSQWSYANSYSGQLAISGYGSSRYENVLAGASS